MAIIDINGNPIKHNEYNEHDKIVNIEFGSGKNYFGKREYPECYLTDINVPSVMHFMDVFPDYLNADCHFIDFTCNFYSHNFNGRLFEKIILCNPYDFGYNGLLEGKFFFDRAGDLLEHNGQLIIICSKSNPFASKKKLDLYLRSDGSSFQSKYKFEVEAFEEMDINHRIVKEYQFKQCCLEKITIPNQKIIIKKNSTRNNEFI
jgi:hypothetical protein